MLVTEVPKQRQVEVDAMLEVATSYVRNDTEVDKRANWIGNRIIGKADMKIPWTVGIGSGRAAKSVDTH